MTRGHYLLDHYIVRLSGFSFSRLERLRFPNAVKSARELLAAEETLERAKSALVATLDDIRFDIHPAFRDPALEPVLKKQMKKARDNECCCARLRPFPER